MQTVIETKPYLTAAAVAGMSDSERERVVLFLAENPEAGDLIRESGGCRKVRIAKDGKGKSGGYRVITWFGGRDIPVFLLTVFAKGAEGKPVRQGMQRARQADGNAAGEPLQQHEEITRPARIESGIESSHDQEGIR